MAWGEFGRTPQINKDGGRDHWPQVGCALLAGGGMKTGQVIGATDRLGGEIAERGVHFGEVFSTLYHQLGIDANQVTLPDLTGRHVILLDDILDSGRTLHAIRGKLTAECAPASVRICVLLRKRKHRACVVDADYVGFDIDDEFVVGYGLDYEGRYRNLPYIGVLSPEAIGHPASQEAG